MSSSARLKYKIARCTSEDPEYPVSELLAHSSQTKGWQTARFCDFPQEICVQFETPVHLKQVQFLSHQNKIATRIDLFTSPPVDGQDFRLDSAEWKRLGYLTLDSNERSGFQARELKSVYVNISTHCLRVLFQNFHVNKYNIVNQVGLIALNCVGEPLGPDPALGPAPSVPSHAAPRNSNPAGIAAATGNGLSKPAPPAEAQVAADPDLQMFDSKTVERLRALTTAKARAVEAEDYEEAKRCKELLARLRQTGMMLRELEDRKKAAVANEDYDAAKALKVEIERLRSSIDRPQQQQPQHQQEQPQPSQFQVAPSAEEDGPAQAPPMSAPRGGQQPRMEHSQPHAFSNQSQDANASAGGSSRGFAQGQSRAGSPPALQQQQQQQDGGPPRLSSPPLATEGGARVAHSPLAAQAQKAHAAPPPPEQPPEQPLEREASASFDENHPLAGVPNAEDLPQPTEVPEKEEDEARGLLPLFGEYLTRCLFSKSWNLREAGLKKVVLELEAGNFDDREPRQLLEGLCALLRRAIPDKNVQVFLACAPILHYICRPFLEGARLNRNDVCRMLEPVMPALTDRLGDANARVDTACRDAHLDFARCPLVGAPFTAGCILKPPKNKKPPPRVCSSRLQLLTVLVIEMGLQPGNQEGVPLEPSVKLAMEWNTNPNADVRESAVKLVGACYAQAGIDRIEPFLAKLRPVQREVFDNHFESLAHQDEEGDVAPASEPAGHGYENSMPPPQVPPPRQQQGPGATGQQQQAQAAQQQQQEEAADEGCQFCGRQDSTTGPDVVDVHYWRDCPMLAQCEFCEQVVEISALQEHWEAECEQEDAAKERADQVAANQCPLCWTMVGSGSDQDWLDHLLGAGCPKNPRDANRMHSHY